MELADGVLCTHEQDVQGIWGESTATLPGNSAVQVVNALQRSNIGCKHVKAHPSISVCLVRNQRLADYSSCFLLIITTVLGCKMCYFLKRV